MWAEIKKLWNYALKSWYYLNKYNSIVLQDISLEI